MDYLELPAPPPLDAIGHCFWFLRGAEAAGEPQVIVTDGRLEIILHRGDPFERRDGQGTWHAQAPTLVSGQLSAVLLKHAVHPPDALAAAAVQALDQPGIPGVEQLALDLGVSARSLERRVLAATGAAPVRLRRMLRFRRAFRLIDQAPAGTEARIAAQAGYYDQAHMLRDFHQFAGAPPSTFFRDDPELARVMLGGSHDG